MKSFRFKESWLKAVEAIADPTIQSELMLAIARYGINGTFTPSENDVVNAVMAIVMAETESSRPSATDSKAVEQVSLEQELFDKAEGQIDAMGMHASPAAAREGIGVCFIRFRNECMAHRRFHSSRHELIEDFRRRISKDIYGIPVMEARFFRRRPASHTS